MHNVYAVSRAPITGPTTYSKYPTLPYRVPTGPGITADDIDSLIAELYPEGISSHGHIHLSDSHPIPAGSDGKDYYLYNPIIELTFELVRLWQFPNLPSRFISGFAWQTIEEAQRFKDGPICNGTGTIIKIETPSFFKADMRLLRSGNSLPGFMINARRYWSGQASDDPQWELLIPLPYKIVELL